MLNVQLAQRVGRFGRGFLSGLVIVRLVYHIVVTEARQREVRTLHARKGFTVFVDELVTFLGEFFNLVLVACLLGFVD